MIECDRMEWREGSVSHTVVAMVCKEALWATMRTQAGSLLEEPPLSSIVAAARHSANGTRSS